MWRNEKREASGGDMSGERARTPERVVRTRAAGRCRCRGLRWSGLAAGQRSKFGLPSLLLALYTRTLFGSVCIIVHSATCTPISFVRSPSVAEIAFDKPVALSRERPPLAPWECPWDFQASTRRCFRRLPQIPNGHEIEVACPWQHRECRSG